MDRVFKRCLITGIAGSGGSYLAEYILKKALQQKYLGSVEVLVIQIF